MTDDTRRAALALMKYGNYDESEDSLEWLRREAADVARAVERGESVVAVLEDTAFIDPGDPESIAAGYAVAHELGVHP